MSVVAESQFFKEKDLVLSLIKEIAKTVNDTNNTTTTTTTTDTEYNMQKIKTIFDKYLESPTLLDPSLQALMEALVTPSNNLITTLYADTGETQSGDDDKVRMAAYDKVLLKSNENNTPFLTPLPPYPLTPLPPSPPQHRGAQIQTLHSLLDLISALCKVRGYKTVKKFFSHEASDLEPTLLCLQSQDRHSSETWTTRYSLLLWLSMLAMVPFDICTIGEALFIVKTRRGKGTNYH
jgi:hypothetical protein